MSLFKRKKDKDRVKSQEDQDHAAQKDKDQPKKVDGLKDEKKEKRPDWAPDVDVKSKKEKGKKTTRGEDLKKTHGQAYKNLIRPIITEKASGLGMYNQYVFEVAPKSNKIEVKKAIQALYGVKPIKVNIINMRGKSVRYGRQMGKLKSWKKAIITLKAGEKIDVYEGV